jgi:hypothetical protein
VRSVGQREPVGRDALFAPSASVADMSELELAAAALLCPFEEGYDAEDIETELVLYILVIVKM